MIDIIIRILRFLSLIVFMVLLLWLYAGFSAKGQVQINPPEGYIISNSAFFYAFMVAFAVISLIFGLLKYYLKNQSAGVKILGISDQKSWQSIITFWAGSANMVLISIMIQIGIWNSTEDLDLHKFSFLVYLGPLLVILAIIHFFVQIGNAKKNF